MNLPRFLLAALLALVLAGCERGPSLRMIGGAAPDFTVKDSDRTVALHDLRGKIVVLNFWAAHCEPCVEEMPSLVQLQRRMGPRIVVLGVGVDTTEDDYHSFLRDHNIDFLTVRDADKASYLLYGATGYPETTIIDSNGTVRRKFVGPQNWTSPEIIEYLNRL
ncbi:MAG TPA: TlpA disulfide reductase family protein [Candidatus Angelobacter sp.]